MTCPVCADKGLIRLRYEDGSPDEFAICLCAIGQDLRNDRNAGRHTRYPLWLVWAARHQIPPARIVMAETVLDDEQLAHIPRGATSRGHAIADAVTTRKPRL